MNMNLPDARRGRKTCPYYANPIYDLVIKYFWEKTIA